MITVCIPFSDNEELTSKCLDNINKNSVGPLEVIVIDNGSTKEYNFNHIFTNEDILFKYIRNEKNVGGPTAFKQGLDASTTDIVCIIHNDVLIHEVGWNNRVEQAFNDDPQLGLGGFFGTLGVHKDGGRMIKSSSNMLGLEWGSPWNHHGDFLDGIEPAACFDGLGLIFRKSFVEDVDSKYNLFGKDRPPHHWYDRHISVAFVAAGYRIATIGIAFDHWSVGSGGIHKDTSKYAETSLEWIDNNLSDQWFINNQLTKDHGFDSIIYIAGLNMWLHDWENRLPLTVDANYNYTWERNE